MFKDLKIFKRTLKDWTDSELNYDFAEWQKYDRLVAQFPALQIGAPDLPYTQDEIQSEMHRRQNNGTRARSWCPEIE